MLGKKGGRCVVKLAKRQGALNLPQNRQVLHCPEHITNVNTRYKMVINDVKPDSGVG